ncbi:MAG: ABC transporter permease [Candidatus Merdousia sp.]|nr:ABC transporter permease [Candidatus Merdousia sp.]
MFGIFKKKTSENGGGLSATAQLVADGDTAVLRFSGVWLLSKKRTPVDEIVQMITPNIKRLSFDTGALKAYDSALVGMLFRCYEACAQLGIEFDLQSLPKGPRELLKLAVAVPEADASPKGGMDFNIINRLGVRAMKYADSFFGQCGFIGEVAIAATKAAFGKARYRGCDLLGIMQAAGPEALPIVALISFLVGLILAFVGAIQLAKYGSEIFVADLVGIAMCREMGAIMVGIVMSGRTGAAFAAELGSMKVNEEISAFRTFGISTAEFLVFPRILALVLMFPLLTIFADVIGMLGGFVIGAGMFDISYDQYVNRTLSALNIVQISTGVGKSFVFGIIVACVGCRAGMNCEKSSAGVGLATTSSVVQSITWIIVADAIFAVIFTIFDI